LDARYLALAGGRAHSSAAPIANREPQKSTGGGRKCSQLFSVEHEGGGGLNVKNPAAPAVKREAEEDWGKREVAMTGKNRIMIYGPKDDGTYVVEFRTAALPGAHAFDHCRLGSRD
jgi:hypothetical protein